MNPCECKNENFWCHAKEGCICRHGLKGDNCTETFIAQTIVHNEETNTGSIIAGCFIALIIIIIILAYLYHRRKVVNLKTEIAHVTYIAEQQGLNTGTGNARIH